MFTHFLEILYVEIVGTRTITVYCVALMCVDFFQVMILCYTCAFDKVLATVEDAQRFRAAQTKFTQNTRSAAEAHSCVTYKCVLFCCMNSSSFSVEMFLFYVNCYILAGLFGWIVCVIARFIPIPSIYIYIYYIYTIICTCQTIVA